MVEPYGSRSTGRHSKLPKAFSAAALRRTTHKKHMGMRRLWSIAAGRRTATEMAKVNCSLPPHTQTQTRVRGIIRVVTEVWIEPSITHNLIILSTKHPTQRLRSPKHSQQELTPNKAEEWRWSAGRGGGEWTANMAGGVFACVRVHLMVGRKRRSWALHMKLSTGHVSPHTHAYVCAQRQVWWACRRAFPRWPCLQWVRQGLWAARLSGAWLNEWHPQ